MNKISNQFSSIEQFTQQYLNGSSRDRLQSSQKSFEEILKEKQTTDQSGIKFSKHASMRLNDRNITLSAEQNERLENAVKEADNKGMNESLVLVDDLAFIVNVPNRTVITAMEQGETNSNVFTNIDGAVIM